jgi:hypothetical protein
MSDNKRPQPKIQRHPGRSVVETYKPYVPQYQVEGIEPKKYQGAIVSPNTPIAQPEPLPLDNPRGRRSPYAATIPSPTVPGRGPVLNVGNNMEHSWSSVDGHIVDDLTGEGVDPNHPMIDNNDEVSLDALGYQNGFTAEQLQPQNQMRPPTMIDLPSQQAVVEDTGDLLSILSDLAEDSYLLLAAGVPICSGPKAEIEDQARALVFGEHEICDGNPIPPEEIVVLRRVQIKMGLFLE